MSGLSMPGSGCSGCPPVFKHQLRALDRWLSQPRLGLALDPGTGKTRTVLEGIRLWWEIRQWLIVAPKRVATSVWPVENLKFRVLDPAQLYVLRPEDLGMFAPTSGDALPAGFQPPRDWQPGERLFRDLRATRTRLRALIASHRVLICPWSLVFWFAAALGEPVPFDGVVIDESHYVKSKTTKSWQAMRRLVAGAGVRVALDGSPASNGWEDVFAPSYLLDGGETFGRSLGDFRRRFLQPYAGFAGRVRYGAPNAAQAAELGRLFPTLWKSMSGEEWAQLPDLIVNDIVVDLAPAHQAAATQLMRAALAELPSGAQLLPPGVAAGIGKALQVCSGACYDAARGIEHFHELKLDVVEELLPGVEGGVLLFYPYQHTRKSLEKRFGKTILFIDDKDAVARWERGEAKILAANPQSMAVGLNLQAAGNTIVWLGLTWDAFYFAQGQKRVHRIGQAAPSVISHRILTSHPVELAQRAALDGKITMMDSLLSLKEKT